MRSNSELNLDGDRAAVLVDAENVPAWSLKAVLKEIEEDDVRASPIRVYADWTDDHVQDWLPFVRDAGAVQVQQLSTGNSKNSVDIRMAIDAVDLLHDTDADTYILVTSDRDFLPVVQRVREEGHEVVGVVDETAVGVYRRALDQVVDLEDLNAGDYAEQGGPASMSELRQPLVLAYENCDPDRKGVLLARFGKAVRDLKPEFEPEQYGYKKFLDVVRQFDDTFDIDKESQGDQAPRYWVKLRNSGTKRWS